MQRTNDYSAERKPLSAFALPRRSDTRTVLIRRPRRICSRLPVVGASITRTHAVQFVIEFELFKRWMTRVGVDAEVRRYSGSFVGGGRGLRRGRGAAEGEALGRVC